MASPDPPLLDRTFVFDTSSIARVHHNPEIAKITGLTSAQIWEKLIDLINQDRMKIPEPVFDELRKVDSIAFDILSRYRNQIVVHVREIEFGQSFMRIWESHPRMSKPLDTKTIADPYVVAYALDNDCIPITNEKYNPDKRPGRMREVCIKEGIECRSLEELLATLE